MQMTLETFYKGKRVLVTGHTGFKGSWLCSILVELDAKVCGIGLKPNTEPSLFKQLELDSRVEEHHLVDIRNLNELLNIFTVFQPEIVIHMAAQPLVLDSYENPVYTYDVNVMGTVNICECVRLTTSVKSFINITTDKLYENLEIENYSYVESDRLNGFDPCSNSKSCSELVTDSYKKSFFSNRDIAVSTCRAGNVIGGGDYSANRILPDCIRAAKKGETIKLRNPNSVRPYQHVLEADLFYLLLAMRQARDSQLEGAYNVGPNSVDVKCTKEICDIFCAFWGRDCKWKCYQNSMKQHEARFLELNNNKSMKILNWKPKLTIIEAVQLVVNWEKAIDKVEETNKEIRSFLKGYIDEKCDN